MKRSPSNLAGLISSGRERRGVPANRAEVLASLLRKRAAAWQCGFEELEAQLRSQISWSLPIEKPEEAKEGEGDPGQLAEKN